MKHNIIWLGMCIFVCSLMLLTFVVLAGHDKTKDGHDAYWQNRIALAHDGAFIDDELVPQFLASTESFDTDSLGELTIGSIRRTANDARTTGWLLEVVQKTEVKKADGSLNTIYSITTSVVFDLRGDK